MKIILAKDYQDISDKAFQIIKDLVEAKPNAKLGLATGSSPVGLYENMVKDHKENGTSYKDVTTVNLDEYVGLDPEHPQSYHTFMKENLFDGLDIPEDHIHIPLADGKDAAKNYDALLTDVDLQLLGIGENGHIGFNEPGTPFDSRTHITDLTENTRAANKRFFIDEEVPTQAITQGIGNIMDAKEILLVANGPKKAQAILDMVSGPVDESHPASVLQKHPNVTVIVDPEAASLLDPSLLS